jgi:phosphatidylinositol-3-phosphatase
MEKRAHRRVSRGLVAVLLCFGAVTFGLTAAGGTGAAAAAGGPCSPTATTPTTYQHVVLIMMENKAYTDISGNPSAPYINSLMSQCAVSQVTATTHPSLPNYIALTSGSTQGITDDNPPAFHPLNVPSIFSQLNGNWHSYAQSMPKPCTLTNSGKYAPRHVPATYYTNIRTLCKTHVTAYGTTAPSLAKKFTFITPNLTNDMHTAATLTQEIKNGDTYLKGFLPKLFATTLYKSGTTEIIVTWDEGNATSNVVPAIVISPTTGVSTLSPMSAVDLLHMMEGQLGLPPL